MNMTRKMWTALGLLLALAMTAGKAQASGGNPAYLDLKVTFTGAFSIAVDGNQSSTQAFNVTTNLQVVTASATVTNDSSGLTEKWQLSVASVPGLGGDWAVKETTETTPGINEYALQAVFMSSAAANQACPIKTDTLWDLTPSIVKGAMQTYISTLFADATDIDGANGKPDENDGKMYATSVGAGHGKRRLCARFYAPLGSSTVGEHVIRLTLTAAPGA